LKDKVLPHVGTDLQSFGRKAYFVGYMTRRLINAFLGKIDEDDRDHYGKKRLDMTGPLMVSLFKEQFKNVFIENAKKIIRR
jgi:DNA-directed RNA polymerase II subunit RPB2